LVWSAFSILTFDGKGALDCPKEGHWEPSQAVAPSP
jgi:hypothetical protein